MTTTRRFGFPGRKTFMFVTGFAVAVGLLSGFALFGVNRISAASCTNNDILKCGFSTPSDFVNKVNANNNGVNSEPDLQAVYAQYGLTQDQYNNFAAHAVRGEAMRDGQIVVNGQVVATGGTSIGRLQSFQGTNPFSVVIDGRTYYGNSNSQVFATGVNEIPVYVLFDSSGTFKFAVMPSCGNPEGPASVVKTTAACQELNTQPVSGQANAYTFTAAATKSGNATITKFVYNFGDGSPTVTETSGSTPVQHAYTSPGTFTASVTVFASVPGNPNLQLPAVSMCAKKITVASPPTPPAVTAACKQLDATPSIDNKMTFTFVAVAVPNSSAKLTSADFDFGDGNNQSGVAPNSDGLSATATHTYTSAGTFTAHAVLHFTNTDGKPVTAPECTAVATPVAPPPTQPPAAAPVLPNTGAGDVIGLFTVISAAGYLGYRTYLHRKSIG